MTREANQVVPFPPTNIASVGKDEKKQPRRRRRSIIRDFCLNTSTHALPAIARSESLHNRLFWTLSFLVFTGLMILFLVKSMLAYFRYPTKIDVSYVSEWHQYFPAVSICNISPMRFDRFIEPFSAYIKMNNLSNVNITEISFYHQLANLGRFLQGKINANESLEEFFFALPSILLSCTYNSHPCSAADFIPFISATYGMCYTFNAKLKDEQSNGAGIRYANQYGGAGKLSLSLYAHSHQYVPYLTESEYCLARQIIALLCCVSEGIGFLALIHDNRQLPLIEAAGLEFAPGRSYKLGYKKKATYFLRPPYTQCTDQTSRLMQEMFNNYDNADYSYSDTACFQICGQVYTSVTIFTCEEDSKWWLWFQIWTVRMRQSVSVECSFCYCVRLREDHSSATLSGGRQVLFKSLQWSLQFAWSDQKVLLWLFRTMFHRRFPGASIFVFRTCRMADETY